MITGLLSVAAITGAAASLAGLYRLPARIPLENAVVVLRPGAIHPVERTSADVLTSELAKRTGLRLKTATSWTAVGPVIAILSGRDARAWGRTVPRLTGSGLPETRTDGFRLITKSNPPTVWIIGHDPRGALYGVGEFLRRLNWSKGHASIPAGLDIASAPARPIRGHQLGYRATANSYDGWDEKQFDQYIRELALFGANAIEGIPFQDDRPSAVMPVSRDVMNRKLSQICAKYGLEYWIWTPADFDLRDQAKRAAMLKRHEELFRDCPRMDGVFFPGGDPGNNPPSLVIPYLADLAKLLRKSHPEGKIWLSMQGFDPPEVDDVYQWIDSQKPAWLGGLVAGPSSPPVPETRRRLDRRYQLRLYPDITHTVRCQFPVPSWDPAFSLTLGREPVNPRPEYYKHAQDVLGPYADGSLSYSDGIHDDVNKAIWTRLDWDPRANVRDILRQYCRFHFGPDVGEQAANGILALENNWAGPLGYVRTDMTHELWQDLRARRADLAANWRFQMCLLRAYYDDYTNSRKAYELALEKDANAKLLEAKTLGTDRAMSDALAVLHRAETTPIHQDWRKRIVDLCADLFRTVRLQTSMPLYHASGEERGCVLDFLDYPLNNRWWLEDEFTRISKLPAESEKLYALELICTWEDPGPGSYYDEVGNIGKSRHVVRNPRVDPRDPENGIPTYWWWDEGKSRRRLSWQTSMDWPTLAYDSLDPSARYTVRLTGYGDAKLRMNGQLATPTVYNRGIGEFKEFPVAQELLKDGHLKLTFDPLDEHTLNWRQQSRVSEVWLLKDKQP